LKDAMRSPIGAIAPCAEAPRAPVTNGDALDGSRPQFSYMDKREWITQADKLGDMLRRSDPANSIDMIKGAWSTPLDPRIEPADRAAGNITNSRAIIDACRPFHWREKFPPIHMPSPEVMKKAREKFSYLFE
jgi:hypothetical protein